MAALENNSDDTMEFTPDRSPSPLTKKQNIIVCWDFDWSMVNHNTDYFVQEKLYGTSGYRLNVLPGLQAKAAAKGVKVFTNFQDTYGWPKLFKDFKLTPKLFAEHMGELPIFKENLQIVRAIDAASRDNLNGTNARNINQYIISNANSVLIDILLKKNELCGNVFKSDQIFTNPGWFDADSGVLRCQRYHNIHDVLHKHDCELCEKNLCKGKVLSEEVVPRHDKPHLFDNLVIYIGDGANDFCPVLMLRPCDYVFVRQFEECRGLEKVIEENRKMVQCHVIKWKDGKDLLKIFERVLPEIRF